MPADVVQVDLGVVSEAALVGPPAVGVLHAVGIECLNFTIVLGDHQLHQHLRISHEQFMRREHTLLPAST